MILSIISCLYYAVFPQLTLSFSASLRKPTELRCELYKDKPTKPVTSLPPTWIHQEYNTLLWQFQAVSQERRFTKALMDHLTWWEDCVRLNGSPVAQAGARGQPFSNRQWIQCKLSPTLFWQPCQVGLISIFKKYKPFFSLTICHETLVCYTQSGHPFAWHALH